MALARAEVDWLPGEAIGEHALTYGHLVGELVRRLDGHSLGRFLAEELCGPLDIDVHIGLGDRERTRTAATIGLTPAWWAAQRGRRGSLRYRALGDDVDDELVNSDVWRRAEVPAVNGHASARGLAGFYAALLRGHLPSGCSGIDTDGQDRVLGEHVEWTFAGGRIDGPDVGMGESVDNGRRRGRASDWRGRSSPTSWVPATGRSSSRTHLYGVHTPTNIALVADAIVGAPARSHRCRRLRAISGAKKGATRALSGTADG